MIKIRKNLIASIVYQLCSMIYGFVLPRLILEQFGSEVNGLTRSISQFLGIIGFLDMGVGQVLRSTLYGPLGRQDHTQISRVMVSGGKFFRKIAFALLGYVVILVLFYPSIVDQSFDWMFTAGLIAIMSIGSFVQYYFGIIQEQLLHADQKSYLVYSIQIVCHTLTLAVSVFLIRRGCQIHAVKLATAVIFLIKPFFCLWHIRRKYSIDWKISYETEPITQKWNGVAQHVSAVVLDGTDNIVLTFFSSLSNVSIYSVYYMIVSSIQNFYQAAVVGLQSAAGAVWAKQDQKNINRLFSSVETGLHTVTTFLFCCTAVLIVPFVRVYTDGLTDTNYIQPSFAIILVLAYGIRCLRTPYNIWILAAGHFKQTQRCHIVAAALNLVLSVLAVSQWGLIGIAVGTLVAMCYQTLWMMLYTTRNLVKCTLSHLLKQCTADAASALLVYLATCRIALQSVSYLGWFIMALKVVPIVIACICAVTVLFYPKKSLYFAKRSMQKVRTRQLIP